MTDPAWPQWKSWVAASELLNARAIDLLKRLEANIWTELMEGLTASNCCGNYFRSSKEVVKKFPINEVFHPYTMQTWSHGFSRELISFKLRSMMEIWWTFRCRWHWITAVFTQLLILGWRSLYLFEMTFWSQASRRSSQWHRRICHGYHVIIRTLCRTDSLLMRIYCKHAAASAPTTRGRAHLDLAPWQYIIF